MIPAKIRTEISGNVLVMTRGIDKCLWLFPPEEWTDISEKLLGSFSIFQKKARLIHRRIIAPAQETEIDRTGRITIPQTLREYANLKKDCIIIGMLKRLEVWDDDVYRSYSDINEDEFQEAAEEIGNELKIL